MKILILMCSFCLLLALMVIGKPQVISGFENALATEKNSQTLVIEYFDGGGMYPESERIYISKDSASYEHYLHGSTTFEKWIPTQPELDSLCNVLVENKYDKIEAEIDRGPVYDRGGESITITLDGTRVHISDSGQSFIKAEWKVPFGKIVAAIRAQAFVKR